MRRKILLLSMLLTTMRGVADCVPDFAAQAEVTKLIGALESFWLRCGRYPTQSEGLSALTNRPIDIPETRWEWEDVPTRDPWSRDYVYRFPSHHPPYDYDVYSRGEDGISISDGGDPDDINSWDTNRSWMRYYSKRRSEVAAKRGVQRSAAEPQPKSLRG